MQALMRRRASRACAKPVRADVADIQFSPDPVPPSQLAVCASS
jgi:hypothetical protein